MFKNKRFISVICHAMICVALISCENFADSLNDSAPVSMEQLLTEGAYSVVVTYIKDETGSKVSATPYFPNGLRDLGVVVRKISYYIDDELVMERQEEPWKMDYYTSTMTGGQHRMRTVITFVDEDGQEDIVVSEKNFHFGYNSIRPVLDYDQYIVEGEPWKARVFTYNPYNDGEDITIEQINCKLNGEEVAGGIGEPYALSLPYDFKKGNIYSFYLTVSYDSHQYPKSMKFNPSHIYLLDIECISKDSRRFYVASYNASSDLYNGEEVYYVGKSIPVMPHNENCELNIYIDANLIVKTSQPDYELKYLLKEMPKGRHTVRYSWRFYDANGKTTSTHEASSAFTVLR